MRAREGMLLLVGAAAGAGVAWWAGGLRDGGGGTVPPVPVDSRPREVPAAGPPAPGRPSVPPAPPGAPSLPTPLPPPEGGAGDPSSPEGLAVRTLALQLELQRALLRRAGPPGEGAPAGGLPVHPYAGRSFSELEEVRARAEAAVQPLLARWREAAPGQEKAAAMKELAVPMLRLLQAGGSPENLLALEEAAERGETADERRWAVIATHTLWHSPVVDYLLARARSPHVDVRFYAVEGLAWVRGEEKARAIGGVVAGLDDPDPGVRGIAAHSLGTVVGDPSRVEDLLARLGREGDPAAAGAMAAAVLELDRTGGRERLRRALAGAPAAAIAAAEAYLRGGR